MRAYGLLIVLMLTGCAVLPPERAITAPVDTAELQASMRPGPATLTGQAFLRQAGGGVVTCAGEEVRLIRATSYTREALRIVQGGERIAGGPITTNEQMRPFVRRTICDAQGRFRFEDLPEGAWLVSTIVQWRVGDFTQGAPMGREVEVSRRRPVEVLMSDGDAVGRRR